MSTLLLTFRNIVHYLLSKGSQSNVVNENGATALYIGMLIQYETRWHIASQEGHLEVVKILIEHGAEIEAIYKDGYTPLYIASQNGRLDVVEYLISQQANINMSCHHGSSPLYIATQQGQLDVVNLLLQKGANAEATKSGFTPFYVACRNGHLEVAKTLLEHGVDIEASDGDGSTPLYVASQK